MLSLLSLPRALLEVGSLSMRAKRLALAPVKCAPSALAEWLAFTAGAAAFALATRPSAKSLPLESRLRSAERPSSAPFAKAAALAAIRTLNPLSAKLAGPRRALSRRFPLTSRLERLALAPGKSSAGTFAKTPAFAPPKTTAVPLSKISPLALFKTPALIPSRASALAPLKISPP